MTKFFLNYCKGLASGRRADNKLKGRAKEIYNEFIGPRDHVYFILLMSKEEKITFLLFCAAANNEL